MQEFALFLQHHWALGAALGVVFLFLIIIEFVKSKQSSHRLNPQAAVNAMNHQNAIVVDIRSADAFAKGHIVGSISLPSSLLEEKFKKLEKYRNQALIVVCATGQDSQRAANALQQKGYNVQILEGGMRAWQLASLPIIKD